MRLAFALYLLTAVGFIFGAMLTFSMSTDVQRKASGPLSPPPQPRALSGIVAEGIVRDIDEQKKIVMLEIVDPFSRHERIRLVIRIQESTIVSALSPDLRKRPPAGNAFTALKTGMHIQAIVAGSSGPLVAQKIFIWP